MRSTSQFTTSRRLARRTSPSLAPRALAAILVNGNSPRLDGTIRRLQPWMMAETAESQEGRDRDDHVQPDRVEPAMPPEIALWRRWSPSRRRLYGEVVAFRGEFRVRAAELTASTPPTSWATEARDLIRIAGERAATGPVSAGFEALNAARRITVTAYSSDEVRAEAAALDAEAKSGKLSEWRSAAIGTLLKGLDAESPLGDTQQKNLLRFALHLRDDGAQNDHRKHEIISGRYWQLVLVVLITVVALITLSRWRPLQLSASASDGSTTVSTPNDWAMWLYVVLFGMIGASVSAGLSLSKGRPDDRIPQVRASTIPAVFRPVFGGAAAIGAFAIFSAGLFADISATNATAAAIAFLAGFSERLIDSVSGRFAANS